MNEHELKYIIEATLLAAGRPVSNQQLLDLFDERSRPTPEQLQTALGMLAADYEQRGIELVEVASGWRIQVRPRMSEIVSRLWQERPSRYSRALLETLALIAYRQPITRSEIEEIRGVAVSSTIMRTLQERNWIRVVGHREVPGRPELLGTTREFLDYFGLKSLDQLPTLAELKDLETIGVQLELPAGEPAEAKSEGEGQTQAASGEDGQAEAASNDAAQAETEANAAENSSEAANEDSQQESAPSDVALPEDEMRAAEPAATEVVSEEAEPPEAEEAAEVAEAEADEAIQAADETSESTEASADAEAEENDGEQDLEQEAADDDEVSNTLVAATDEGATAEIREPEHE